MNNKKSNTLIVVLIVVAAVSAMVAIIIFSLSKTTPEDKYFNRKKKGAARMLYSDLMSLSEDSDFSVNTDDNSDEEQKTGYPQTPKELIAFYLKGTRLLYGDMVADETIIPNILRKQRLLYSSELIAQTTLEEQENSVKTDMANLKINNTCVVECAVGSVIFYENDMNKAYVCVTLESNLGSKSYWKYFVKRDDNGFWRIDAIQTSNETFTD